MVVIDLPHRNCIGITTSCFRFIPIGIHFGPVHFVDHQIRFLTIIFKNLHYLLRQFYRVGIGNVYSVVTGSIWNSIGFEITTMRNTYYQGNITFFISYKEGRVKNLGGCCSFVIATREEPY